ncbi:MAG: LptF/LptG family permease [Sphaerochaetaceae bacterium]
MRNLHLRYTTLHLYILKQFLVSLVVAFSFFFFIFFVNQLLLLAQKVMLRNVNITHVTQLVILATPQILLYSIPFSTLTASAMVFGDLAENNEVVALRSGGLSLFNMTLPVILCAVVLTVGTFVVADVLLPMSSYKMKALYSELMQDIPTLDLDSYSAHTFGDITLLTGKVENGIIEDVLLMDNSKADQNMVVSATKGSVELVDLHSFVYRLTLEDPYYLSTDRQKVDEYTYAQGSSLTYYIDFTHRVAYMSDITPSQLSTRDLLSKVHSQLELYRLDEQHIQDKLHSHIEKRAALIRDINHLNQNTIEELNIIDQEIARLKKQKPMNFYIQYYRAELHKKLALSLSTLILVFVSFPLALMKVKHGKVFGFALSLVVASMYWFSLFFAQTKILDVSWHPGILMWAPNMLFALISLVVLQNSRRL